MSGWMQGAVPVLRFADSDLCNFWMFCFPLHWPVWGSHFNQYMTLNWVGVNNLFKYYSLWCVIPEKSVLIYQGEDTSTQANRRLLPPRTHCHSFYCHKWIFSQHLLDVSGNRVAQFYVVVGEELSIEVLAPSPPLPQFSYGGWVASGSTCYWKGSPTRNGTAGKGT